ncbi:MAG: cytochrome c oxidase subunit 3 [Planctomycetota bacterium]|jgi:cytochrome c oxidase subunit 3
MHDDSGHGGASGHEHPDFLAHHFDTAPQQFEAAKLGMWMFLATEVLLFGGLFCLYTVFRANQSEVFEYGSQFLDVNWGAINTAVLIISSFTMATAVWCAQAGRQKLLAFFLLMTLLFAADFLVIKYIEYSHKIHEHLVWGTSFYEPPYGVGLPTETVADATGAAGASGESGKSMWMATCRSCHGPGGEGIPGQGKDIRGSEFIAGMTDQELVEFIKVGRMPFDPLNTTGIQMPPRGGNPLLSDADLLVIVGHLRTITAAAPAPETEGEEAVVEEEFWIPMSTIPPAQRGPVGLDIASLEAPDDDLAPEYGEPPHHAFDPDRPDNAHMFFGMYFLMTGLHGLHVAAGMIVIIWLLIKTLRGQFSREYFTPVDLGGLYWHVVDLIWIFLFPLLYLI